MFRPSSRFKNRPAGSSPVTLRPRSQVLPTTPCKTLHAYVVSGEPLQVAGAFTIDSLGGPFIDSVHGDPSTVVGMSLSTVRRLARELGVSWPSLWNRRSYAGVGR